MTDRFSIPIELTDNKTVNFYEFKNRHFFNLLKLIQNQNLLSINDYYNSILAELTCVKDILNDLNFVDKFIILVTLRSICVSPDIEFEIKKENKITKKVELYNIIKTLNNINFTKEIKIKSNILIKFSLPKQLFYSSIDEIIEDCIKCIAIKDEYIDLNSINADDKKNIFKTLPGSIFTEAKKYFYELENILNNYILIKKEEFIELEEIKLSLTKNTCIGILNSIFRDNLFNFYNLMYVFTNKLHMSLTEYLDITPAESGLILSFYTKEQEDIKKANENKKIPIGKQVD